MMDRNELLKVMKEHARKFEEYEEGLKILESCSDDIKFNIYIDLSLICEESYDTFEKELKDIVGSLNTDVIIGRTKGHIEIECSFERFEDFRFLAYTIDYFMHNHYHDNTGYWSRMGTDFTFENDGSLDIWYYEDCMA